MTRRNPSYFVVMIDYGKRRGLEAIVQPEITKREVISRIKSGEYNNIAFIHHYFDGLTEDVTDDLVNAAEFELKEELRAARSDDWADHRRDMMMGDR